MAPDQPTYGMPAPHWIADAIGDNRSVDEISRAILGSPQFKSIVSKAVNLAEVAEDQAKQVEEDEGKPLMGGNFATDACRFIIDGFNHPKGHVSAE